MNMLNFRDALLDALGRGKRFLLKDIAAAVELSPDRIARWRRLAGFSDWLDLEIDLATRRLVNPMHYAQMQQAFHSLPHYQTQLRRLGLESPFDAQASPDAGGQVNGVQVNLYGIPTTTPDRSTLPPPIMRDPTTGAIVPIPPRAPLPLVGDSQTPAAK